MTIKGQHLGQGDQISIRNAQRGTLHTGANPRFNKKYFLRLLAFMNLYYLSKIYVADFQHIHSYNLRYLKVKNVKYGENFE